MIGVLVGVIIVLLICYNIDNVNDSKIVVSLDKCVDGDTTWFLVDGKRVKVRLLGIDTPEVDEEFGNVASSYTCDVLVNSKNIYLEYDDNSDRYDKYNRLLAWVFVDTNNLSELLVSKGYARVRYIYGDYKYIDVLCDLEANANKDMLGIWNIGKYKYEDGYCYKSNLGSV